MKKNMAEKLTATNQNFALPVLIAMQSEILDALNAGWQIKKIWRQMVADNLINLSYENFYYHVRTKILPQIRQRAADNFTPKKETSASALMPQKSAPPSAVTATPATAKLSPPVPNDGAFFVPQSQPIQNSLDNFFLIEGDTHHGKS